VECKLTERPDEKDVRGIRRLKAFYGEDQVIRAYVACLAEPSFDIVPGVTAINGWETWPLDG
jgi:hypothetical protein